MSNTIQTYNQQFLAGLEQLNDTQRHAVAHTEGPVLVLAGPGTGKTHILASRIGNILLTTDAQAHNILCLTFTDAGAIAMRQRLLQLIGPEAHKVHVFTFHSFCNYIIKSHSEYFGQHDLEPLNRLEQVEIIRQLMDNLPAENPLINGRADYFYENHLRDLFETIKKENWTEKDIQKAIDDYLTSLPTRDEFIYKRKSGDSKAGDLKTNDYNEAVAKMQRLSAAAALFSDYEAALKTRKRYDFNDMILWVIAAFQKNESLLLQYQEQYLYFLVDEFQDTNGAQFRVLQQLIAFWDNPNVFIVGDDDQAIYEFQGARLQSFVEFFHRYEADIEVIVLKENYRSSQPILDSAKTLIDNNKIRIINQLESLNLDKNLLAANQKNIGLPVFPSIFEFPTLSQEIVSVFNKIEQLHLDGFSLEKIAVLYVQNKQGAMLMELMDKKNIPYTTKRAIDILGEKTMRQLLLILQYIDAELKKSFSGNALLFQILHFRCWQIPAKTIAQLSVALHRERTLHWREIIDNQEFLAQYNIADVQQLHKAASFLETCIENIYEENLPLFIDKIINQSGLLQQALLGENVGLEIQILQTFSSFVQQENTKQSNFTLQRLVNMLEQMVENRIPIEIQRTIDSSNGVFFSTIHSAKGLEFDYVFMIDSQKEYWEDNKKTGVNKFSLPDTLTLTKEEDLEEARRRLFYVGMTRAKTTLEISYSTLKNDGKNTQRTLFIDELLLNNTCHIEQKEVAKAILLELGILRLEEKKTTIQATEAALIQEKLATFVLTATSLIAYVDCPLSFYYQHILGVPSQGSEYATYGLVLHRAFQVFFNKSTFLKQKKWLPLSDFIHIFEKEMENRRHDFSSIGYERRVTLGRKHLEKYYTAHIEEWALSGQTEVYIAATEVNGVPIKGTIDKIEFTQNGMANIVDYKSAKYKSSQVSSPTAQNKGGGNYRIQLLFYKLLYENWKNATKTIEKATLIYLEPDNLGQFIKKDFNFLPDEIHTFKALLKTTYDNILEQKFYTGCGKATCQWCDFARTQVLSDNLTLEVSEGLDDM